LIRLEDLPKLNAVLNATAAVLLVCAYTLIKRGRREAHKRVMLAAFSISVLFLISYLTYHAQVGSVRYPHPGPIRSVSLNAGSTRVSEGAVIGRSLRAAAS